MLDVPELTWESQRNPIFVMRNCSTSGVTMSQARSVYDHTSLEWEGIRDVFTRLYVEEDRQLADIRYILGRQGFHATCVRLQVAAPRILTCTSE
jgi:hypothetical protein